MPVYDYKCAGCGNTFSVMVSERAKDEVKCPRCESKSLKQAFTASPKGKERNVFHRCG